MTGPEFLDNFNLLYNNIMSNQAPGLDINEIALFLTKAEQELIKNYFNPKSNPKQEGFEDSPKRVTDFATLTEVYTAGITNDIYKVPSNYVYVVNESSAGMPIILLSPEEYNRVLSKPYPYPPKRIVWKVAEGSTSGYRFRIISEYSLQNVTIVGIRMPKAFTDNFYLSNNPCELPEYMHPEVVQRAIELAKAAWLGDLNSALNIGQRVE